MYLLISNALYKTHFQPMFAAWFLNSYFPKTFFQNVYKEKQAEQYIHYFSDNYPAMPVKCYFHDLGEPEEIVQILGE